MFCFFPFMCEVALAVCATDAFHLYYLKAFIIATYIVRIRRANRNRDDHILVVVEFSPLVVHYGK